MSGEDQSPLDPHSSQHPKPEWEWNCPGPPDPYSRQFLVCCVSGDRMGPARSSFQPKSTPDRNMCGTSSIRQFWCGTVQQNFLQRGKQEDPHEVKKQLLKGIQEIRSKIISKVRKQMITIMKAVLSISKEYSDKKIHENRKMMESLNQQYKKEMESMKQIQSDIQEVKPSVTSWKTI